MINYDRALVDIIKSEVLNARMHKLSESDKRIIDTLEKLGDYISKYNEMTPQERDKYNYIISRIALSTINVTYLSNGLSRYI